MKKGLKKAIAFIASSVLVISALVGCSSNTTKDNGGETTNELKTVRLNEVVRSVFYAPMYIAINEGFFEEEGLSIDLSTGQGADATHSKQHKRLQITIALIYIQQCQYLNHI